MRVLLLPSTSRDYAETFAKPLPAHRSETQTITLAELHAALAHETAHPETTSRTVSSTTQRNREGNLHRRVGPHESSPNERAQQYAEIAKIRKRGSDALRGQRAGSGTKEGGRNSWLARQPDQAESDRKLLAAVRGELAKDPALKPRAIASKLLRQTGRGNDDRKKDVNALAKRIRRVLPP